ncbi:MAG TPA: peptide MFS transporter [Pyrinomonadaceae bacterium]|jgi:POT family proton-dependent oligopeptide transporter|nr:peptide MFS transporter [Pyrinomonadaceae bacterium]
MSTPIDASGASSEAAIDTGFFGHPRGLSTLFFTEMWERFSYYGMRALLTLYMTSKVLDGGLGFDEAYSSVIYASYVSSVWYLPLVGGWLADKVLGARRAVLLGGIIIACGHYSMAFDSKPTFYVALVLIAFGTGLLKPNISSMVGQLYSPEDKRRDAGFSIFYMGINLGAFISPFVTGFLAQGTMFKGFISSIGFNPAHAWHWGFAAAGVGMTIGVIQYVLGGKRLRDAGQRPTRSTGSVTATSRGKLDMLTSVLAVVGALLGAGFGYRYDSGWITVPFWTVCGYFVGYLGGTTRLLKGEELMRVLVIYILVLFSIIFWMTYEQAGSSLTLFADRLTRNAVFGWSFPSSFWQSVPAIFVIMLAPVFAFIWQRMGDRQPSSPAKFSLGLLFAGIAFVIITIAARFTGAGRVSPLWLLVVYFIQTVGEMCLSPVGLSTITRLSPVRMVGLMMGVWFLSISVGSYIAGRTTQLFVACTPEVLTRAFGIFAGITLAAALLLALLTPLIKKMTPRAESS